MNRLLACLFLVVVLLSFPQAVSADVVAPGCNLQISPTSLTASDSSISVSYDPASGLMDDNEYRITYHTSAGDQHTLGFNKGSGPQNVNFTFNYNDLILEPQTIYIESGSQQFCSTNIVNKDGTGTVGNPGAGAPPDAFNLCQQAGNNHQKCDDCLATQGIWSGVGCIPYGTGTGTVRAFIVIGLGITGTVVVLTTLYAGFMFSTSQGDPKRVDEAKSAMTSAIIGAFFIIFSVTILRFIGVTVLHIPAFG